MMYLLDTNVISETIKKTPNQRVLDFLISIDADKFALSVITLGEIRKGAEKLQDQSKKQKIIHWLEADLTRRFYGRIINIDAEVADKWGYISSMNIIPAIDALIAASAIVHNHKLITRNVKDFEAISGLEIINPWDM
jgi:predicted nucleic acid-binding protein